MKGKRKISTPLSMEEIRLELAATVTGHGGQSAWARRHGLSVGHINDVLHGRKDVTATVAQALGYERKFIFVKRI